TYRFCDQPGCVNTIELNSMEDPYNQYGIICAKCAQRYHEEELKQKQRWNQEEDKKATFNIKYERKPFPYLHWSVLRNAAHYETKRKRGRPSTKDKKQEETTGEDEASTYDPDFIEEEDSRLMQMNDLQRI